MLDTDLATDEDYAELMTAGVLPGDDGIDSESDGFTVASVDELESNDVV